MIDLATLTALAQAAQAEKKHNMPFFLHYFRDLSPDVILAILARIRELEAMNHADRQYLTEKESKLVARLTETANALTQANHQIAAQATEFAGIKDRLVA